MHNEKFKNYTIRQKIAVVAAMIHGILFSLYDNCRNKIQALNSSRTSLILEDQ
jgi:uncharacterized membrane protein